MKTNRFPRSFLKIRFAAFCLVVLGLAGAGFSLGESLNVRYGVGTALRAASQAPNVSLADAMGRFRN